ncbi:MAG: sporulation protein YqfD [Roseburia sp.]
MQKKKRYAIDFFGKVITLPTLSGEFECADKTTDYKQLCLHGDFYLPLGIYSSTLKEYRTEQKIYTKEQAEAVATENFNIYLSHLAEKKYSNFRKKCYYRYGR